MAVYPTEGKEWSIDKAQGVAPLASGGNGGALMSVIGWGTGNAAEAVGVTFGSAGITEASEARVVGTLSQPTATTDRLVGTLTADGTKNITQAWRTNTTTKGDAGQRMFIYTLFTAVPMQLADSIAFTFDMVQT